MVGLLFNFKNLLSNIMSTYNNQNILFVVNPVAGGGVDDSLEDQIKHFYTEQDKQYHIFKTTGDNDARAIKELMQQNSFDRVVSIGGDGTIKMLAHILIGKDIPLGIIPSGSANGMATELNIPTEIEACLDTIVNGQVVNTDAIRINNDELCLHLSDIGMNAHIVKYYQENNWRGKLGYLRGAIKMWFNRKQMSLTIHRNGDTIHRDAYMVVLANARMYGTKVIINPNGDVQDGRFEIVIIKKLTFIETLKLFFRFTNYNPQVIESITAESVDINVKRSMYFQIDGEYIGKRKRISAKIEEGKLPIILPCK